MLGTDSRRIGPHELTRIGYVSENQELPGWMTVDQLIAYVRSLSQPGAAPAPAGTPKQ